MRRAQPWLTNRARALRANATSAEDVMWQALRSRRLCGLKFVRQQPMGAYFVDFACREAKVVIEIDGVTHTTLVEQARDDARGAFLESKGYRVVRVTNTDV